MVPLWAAGQAQQLEYDSLEPRQAPEVVMHVCNHSTLSARKWEAEMGESLGAMDQAAWSTKQCRDHTRDPASPRIKGRTDS